MEKILEEINNILDDAEEWINNLKDNVVEITQSEQWKEKWFKT